MNDKRNSTRAHARIDTYELSERDEECRRLIRSFTNSDLKYFQAQARKLTPGGKRLLHTVCSMTIKSRTSDVLSKVFVVRPFTRAELGNELRRGSPLNPHDIKLLRSMIQLHLLREDRQALPAKRMVGVSGDELVLGAGWQFVYIIRPQAALSILYAIPKQRPHIEKLMAGQDEQRLPYVVPPMRWPWQRK